MCNNNATDITDTRTTSLFQNAHVGMVITINDVHERTLYVFLYFVCFQGLLPRVLRREHAYVFHSPPQSFTTTGDN